MLNEMNQDYEIRSLGLMNQVVCALRSLSIMGGIKNQAPVVQTSDSTIHRINHYPADRVIDFRNTYTLNSDLSGG